MPVKRFRCEISLFSLTFDTMKTKCLSLLDVGNFTALSTWTNCSYLLSYDSNRRIIERTQILSFDEHPEMWNFPTEDLE